MSPREWAEQAAGNLNNTPESWRSNSEKAEFYRVNREVATTQALVAIALKLTENQNA